MSDSFPAPRKSLWRRLEPLSWFYLLLLLSLCGLAVWRPLTAQEDFWAHVAVGRWISENGDVPRATLFLWSASEPWVAHPWLSQLTFYGLTAMVPDESTPYVVLLFTAGLVMAPYTLAWRVWARNSRPSSWMVVPFGLAIVTNFHRYQPRPELFTALFLSCLLVFLIGWSAPGQSAADAPTRRTVWQAAAILFGMFVAWANFHGAVLVGLLLLASAAVCDLFQDRFDRRSRVLAALALLGPLGVCVNPYGLAYWQAFAPLGSYRFTCLTEWWPLWQVDPLPVGEIAVQAVLVSLALAAWAMNPQRRWSHLAWLLILAGLYAKANRNVWLLTLGSLLVLAANSRAMAPERLWQGTRRRRPAAAGSVAAIPAAIRWGVRLGCLTWLALQITLRVFTLRHWDEPYRPATLDAGVIQFLKEHRPPGRMFNDFESSRYLQCQLAGEPELFIDVHMAYPDQVMRDYQQILLATSRSRELLDEYRIGYVVLTVDRTGPSLRKLADRLDGDKRWQRVQAGEDGIVWVRRTPEYEYLWGDRDRAVNPKSFGQWETWKRGEGAHSHFSP